MTRDCAASCAQANLTYRVVKNTLAIRAAEGTPMEQVKDNFIGRDGGGAFEE